MIEIGKIQEVLYSQVRPVLKNKSVDLKNKKKLACQYVYLMADMRSGKEQESELRPRYKGILALIKQSQVKA